MKERATFSLWKGMNLYGLVTEATAYQAFTITKHFFVGFGLFRGFDDNNKKIKQYQHYIE